MVWELKCDCHERNELKINSMKEFEDLRDYFNEQVLRGVFSEVEVTEPYYIGYSELQKKEIKWYATRWYKCNSCNCLWEFQYPDFPAKGFVRKFVNGSYKREN